MENVFISKLKPLLDAIAEKIELYVPKKAGEHYVYSRYDAASDTDVELNNIRPCTPIKEFLQPGCELASISTGSAVPEIKPFAIFGLKDCDLRSIAVLDKVFLEEEFNDPFYAARRESMFIIASDCFEPGESCFCNILDGQPFAQSGFDLNVSKIKDGFIIEAGSQKGKDFIGKNSEIFAPEFCPSHYGERSTQGTF